MTSSPNCVKDYLYGIEFVFVDIELLIFWVPTFIDIKLTFEAIIAHKDPMMAFKRAMATPTE